MDTVKISDFSIFASGIHAHGRHHDAVGQCDIFLRECLKDRGHLCSPSYLLFLLLLTKNYYTYLIVDSLYPLWICARIDKTKGMKHKTVDRIKTACYDYDDFWLRLLPYMFGKWPERFYPATVNGGLRRIGLRESYMFSSFHFHSS